MGSRRPQRFGGKHVKFSNGRTLVTTFSGETVQTEICARVGKEPKPVCECYQFASDNDNVSQFKIPGAGVSSHVTVHVNDESGNTVVRHDSVVWETGWVLKNLELFNTVFRTTSIDRVPAWFKDMFVEIMDRLVYDMQCDDLPEMLTTLRDYISGLDRPVGKENENE